MRRLRIAIVLAVATCVCATTAATAMGEKVFRATRLPKPISEAEPGKTAGNNFTSPTKRGEQEFIFGPFKIQCEKAHSTGIVNKETFKDFAIQIKFGKCLTEAHFGTFIGGLKTSFNEGKPISFVYHINNFAEVGEAPEGTEVKISGGEANFKIAAKICKINWPAQTVPAKATKEPEGEFSAAVYSNSTPPEFPNESLKKFPSGFQTKLYIANEFKGMAYEMEEGQCVGEGGFEEEVNKTEGKNGKYTGTLLEEVGGGNLEIAEI